MTISMPTRHLVPLLAGAVLLLGTQQAFAGGQLYTCDDLAERAALTGFAGAVYQGDDGWFFRNGELNHLFQVEGPGTAFLTRLDVALALHQVELVLLPVPPKAVLDADHATVAAADSGLVYDAGFAREQFHAAVTTLKDLGLDVVDVLAYIDAHPPAESDFYFAQDLHWRPKFAELSAAATAELISAGPSADIVGTKSFTTGYVETIKQVNRPNSNKYLNQLCAEVVPGEDLEIFTTTEGDASIDAFLEEETMAPVSIIGTSFTDELNPYNYAGFLRQSLQADVAGFAISGGDIDQSLYKWAHQGMATSGTRVLLWEIPYLDRLEGSARAMQRQVIPAIVGSCEGTPNAVASAAYELSAEGNYDLKLDPGTAVSGDGYYLSATIADTSTPGFILTFTYRDGQQDIVPLVRPDRVGALPSFFAELSADIDSELDSVAIRALQPGANSGTIALCKYPSELPGTTG
jgi:hypothetical protein